MCKPTRWKHPQERRTQQNAVQTITRMLAPASRRNAIISRLRNQQPNIYPNAAAAARDVNAFRNQILSNNAKKAIMCNFVRGCTHNSR